VRVLTSKQASHLHVLKMLSKPSGLVQSNIQSKYTLRCLDWNYDAPQERQMHERLSYANHTAGGTSAVSVQFVGGILRHCIQYGHTECHKQVSRRDTAWIWS
jgi:hypothetical protein